MINSGKNGVNVKVNKKTNEIIDDGLEKYRKMLQMGIPSKSILQKLQIEIPKINDYITNKNE